ncbi:kinase-like domain-containing protein [Hyaloraphidium curvatum]|nr:kinase-like domain-containing protein [Hyaloraphidium curvatum]
MTLSPEPPPKPGPFLKPKALSLSQDRIRLTVQRSMPEFGDADLAGLPGITPDGAKVAKPTPRAFHSTGLLTKRNNKRLSTVSLPDTPSKKPGAAASLEVGGTGAWGFPSSDSAFGSGVTSGMHSENESPLSSTKSVRDRTPFSGSPLFSGGRFQSLVPSANGEISPVSPPHPVSFARHPFFAGQRSTLPVPSAPTRTEGSDTDMNSGGAEDADETSSNEDRDWFSVPNSDDHMGPYTASRPHSEASFNTSLSEMSDVAQAPDDVDGAAGGWRRSSLDRRSENLPKLPAPELIYTPYPRFLRPDCYDFEANAEKIDPDAPRPSENDYFETSFVIIRPLGKGSFADAFKVQSRIDRKPYAIKRTRHPYNGHRDRSKRLTEVDIMWKVGIHPNCVQLLDAWEQRGHLYLQMELCAGGSLQAYLEENAGRSDFTETRIWRTLGEIAQGLAHIHSKDIIHLDIKPANIFIVPSWKLKIGDFGLATTLPVTKNVEREGDRIYIAKEILSANYGKPADVFSLGLVMLEVAAGVILPDYGDDWHKLRNGDFSGVASFGPASSVLQKLIKSMMHPDPAQRPTAAEIASHPLIGIWFF